MPNGIFTTNSTSSSSSISMSIQIGHYDKCAHNRPLLKC